MYFDSAVRTTGGRPGGRGGGGGGLQFVANAISFPREEHLNSGMLNSRAGHYGTLCGHSVGSDCFDRICRLQTMEAICATSGIDDPSSRFLA